MKKVRLYCLTFCDVGCVTFYKNQNRLFQLYLKLQLIFKVFSNFIIGYFKHEIDFHDYFNANNYLGSAGLTQHAIISVYVMNYGHA